MASAEDTSRLSGREGHLWEGLSEPPSLRQVFTEFIVSDPVPEAGDTAANTADKIPNVPNVGLGRKTIQKLTSK